MTTRYRVLGGVRVGSDDDAASLGPKVRVLLAELLARRNTVVATGTLTEALWGEAQPQNPRASLHTLLSRLRSVIGADLVRHADGYSLRVEDDRVDAGRFEGRVRFARSLEPSEAVVEFRRAEAEWKGEPYGDCDTPHVVFERTRLQNLRSRVVEERLSAMIASGDVAGSLPELEALVDDSPLVEELTVLKAKALVGLGRRRDALACLADHRAELVETSGLGPTERIRELESAILSDRFEIPPSARRSVERVRHNLPRQRTELVGRSEEIERVVELSSVNRLVTLTGVGGVGKTRLALAAAEQIADDFADGAFFVDLAPATDGALVAVAASEALGVPIEAEKSRRTRAVSQLASKVAHRRMLIVIDNCEHVIDEAAELIDELLLAGDAVRVIATSREALEVDGERIYRVPSLPVVVDGRAGPAYQLLVDRAVAADDTFRTRAGDRDTLLRICERMDGIPLAIELAAVQLRSSTPTELLERLDDRFRMLVGGPRRRRQRQQTLQAMMDWSWALLTPNERTVLAQMSVFAGGFTLAAVEGVCTPAGAPVEEVVRSLVAKSLVVADHGHFGSRFRLLETVRLYGELNLAGSAQAAAVRRRHASWFAAWADSYGFEDQWACSEVASRLRADIDNLRAAVDWLVEAQDHRRLAQIVRACTFLWRHGFSVTEAMEWTAAVDHDQLDPVDRSRLLLARAEAEYVDNDYEGMRARARDAYRDARDARDDAVAAAALTISAQGLSFPEPQRAVDLLEEAAERAHRAGARRVEAVALALLALTGRQLQWPRERRRRLVERATGLCGGPGWDRGCAFGHLAMIHIDAGEPERAIEINRELASEADRYDLRLQAARSWLSVAWAAAMASDRDTWREATAAAHARYDNAASSRGRPDTLLAVALWEAYNGDPERAAQLLATVRTEELHDMGAYEMYHLARLRITNAGLSDDTIGDARRRGASVTVADALAEELPAILTTSNRGPSAE